MCVAVGVAGGVTGAGMAETIFGAADATDGPGAEIVCILRSAIADIRQDVSP
jgi:hypothetical protein